MPELKDLAATIRQIENRDDDEGHDGYCDYLHRSPARRSDCECGAFDRRRGERNLAIEALLEAIEEGR